MLGGRGELGGNGPVLVLFQGEAAKLPMAGMTRGTRDRVRSMIGKAKGKASNKPPVLSVIPGNVSDIPEPKVVALVRGQGKNEYGLTGKQEAFCQGVAMRGETLATAYRSAYDADSMTAHTIHCEASKLMARQDVAARVNDLVRQKQAKESHDGARIRSKVIEGLQWEALNPDNPASVRVRAFELLGKLDIVQAFKDKATDDAHSVSNSSDLAATLEARLKALTSKAG